MNPAGLLVNHLAGAGGGTGDREGIVVGAACYFLRVSIKRIEVELAIAIRQEVHRIVDPHRLSVVATVRGLGDFFVRQVVQLEDPDPGGSPTSIILPLAPDFPKRRIRQVFPIRRDRSHVGGRDRHWLGNTSRDADREELGVPAREDRALRAEQNFAVGGKPAHDVLAGVPGQPRRLAPLRGNHIDVHVAIIAGREGDVLAVRREVRVPLLARV